MSRGRTVDRVGQRFGRLVILEHLSRGRNGRVRCMCDCGREHVAICGNIVSHLTRSCGCLNRELAGARLRTHGLTRTWIFFTHRAMRARCENPSVPAYRHYGGRGITVCAGWHGVERFAADMGPRPSRRHSLDRIDNDGGYWCGRCAECVSLGRPANCRWATPTEQARNTRRSIRVTVDGERRPLAELYERSGVSRQLCMQRIASGWDPAAAATVPARSAEAKRISAEVQRGKPHHRLDTGHVLIIGELQLTLREWSLLTGIDVTTLRSRERAGWPTADVIRPGRQYHRTERSAA